MDRRSLLPGPLYRLLLTRNKSLRAKLEADVDRGIALLDERGPLDWRNSINLDTLNVLSLSKCIVGQLYGDYMVGIRKLLYMSERASDHGFAIAGEEALFDTQQWHLLTRIWKEKLAA